MTRILDILFSSVAMVLLLPFLLPIMIILRFTGEHDIFYLQPRIGRYGRSFHVIKFATMLRDSSRMPGGFITQKNDPRVLVIGGFLRKTKINELPQLVNVFLGQMSFVGPRPIVAQHLALYPIKIRDRIMEERPGLTGIGSLIFRDEEGVLNRWNGDRKYFHDHVIAPYKGQLESWYIDNKSLIVYFVLIILTAWAVVRPRNSFHLGVFRSLPALPVELKPFL